MLLNFPRHVAKLSTIGEVRRSKRLVKERKRTLCLDNMGSEGAEIKGLRKLRLLGLHGFRTSGEIMMKQLAVKWPESVLEKLDLGCVDAPFPCRGKSAVIGLFDPPYYEWFQFNKEFEAYENFDECLAYVEDCMIKRGPFDGLLGFSQGGFLAGVLPGMQANGAATLIRVPKIKLVVIISGGKIKNPSMKTAYASPIQCRSLHFLDDKGLESMLDFLERVQQDVEDEEQETGLEDDDMIEL